MELKKQYDKLVSKRKIVLDELSLLEQDEEVKRYIALKEEDDKMQDTQAELYQQLKYAEYDSCNHILVSSKVTYDALEGRKNYSYGCIKCGLNEEVMDDYLSLLTPEEEIMHNYFKMKATYVIPGVRTGYTCNLDLARAIYRKVVEANPDIDDETARTDINNFLNSCSKLTTWKLSIFANST